jgi:hypothetical protein
LTPEASGLSVLAAPDGVVFWIHVTPRARREQVGGLHGDALRVAVAAPPVGGEANRECLRALAGALGVERSALDLDPGSKSRRKRVRARGPAADLERRLRALASEA